MPFSWCCLETGGLTFCIPLSVNHWLQDGVRKIHLSKTAAWQGAIHWRRGRCKALASNTHSTWGIGTSAGNGDPGGDHNYHATFPLYFPTPQTFPQYAPTLLAAMYMSLRKHHIFSYCCGFVYCLIITHLTIIVLAPAFIL